MLTGTSGTIRVPRISAAGHSLQNRAGLDRRHHCSTLTQPPRLSVQRKLARNSQKRRSSRCGDHGGGGQEWPAAAAAFLRAVAECRRPGVLLSCGGDWAGKHGVPMWFYDNSETPLPHAHTHIQISNKLARHTDAQRHAGLHAHTETTSKHVHRQGGTRARTHRHAHRHRHADTDTHAETRKQTRRHTHKRHGHAETQTHTHRHMHTGTLQTPMVVGRWC